MKIQTNKKSFVVNSSSFDAVVGEGAFNSQGFAVRTGLGAGVCHLYDPDDGCAYGDYRKSSGLCGPC